jgi:hypothetical protein
MKERKIEWNNKRNGECRREKEQLKNEEIKEQEGKNDKRFFSTNIIHRSWNHESIAI